MGFHCQLSVNNFEMDSSLALDYDEASLDVIAHSTLLKRIHHVCTLACFFSLTSSIIIEYGRVCAT